MDSSHRRLSRRCRLPRLAPRGRPCQTMQKRCHTAAAVRPGESPPDCFRHILRTHPHPFSSVQYTATGVLSISFWWKTRRETPFLAGGSSTVFRIQRLLFDEEPLRFQDPHDTCSCEYCYACLLYTSDAADEEDSVD